MNKRDYELILTCPGCGREEVVVVALKDYFAFELGEKVQVAFPYLTPSQREVLLGGICGECWKEMFPFLIDF